MIRWIRSRITMKQERPLFIDLVSKRVVYLYRDCYGVEWMAERSRWGFRVERPTPEAGVKGET